MSTALNRTPDRNLILAGNTFGMGEQVVTVEDKLLQLLSFTASAVQTVGEARDTIARLRGVIEQVRVIAQSAAPDALEQILALTETKGTR